MSDEKVSHAAACGAHRRALALTIAWSCAVVLAAHSCTSDPRVAQSKGGRAGPAFEGSAATPSDAARGRHGHHAERHQGSAAPPTERRVWVLPEVPVHERTHVTDARILNREATIPPQCYTKTEARHNPCYVCHQRYDRTTLDRLNPRDDGELQGEYQFSEVGVENHYTNLFVDRRAWVASIDDAHILAFVDSGNYAALPKRLRARGFRGFIPDLAHYAAGRAAFDEGGLARDGSAWVAFRYKPFLGTFWPTNGAADDVLVRLPKAFRERGGRPCRVTYFLNLTLVELSLKNLPQIPIAATDEADIGVDLDADGKLGTAVRLHRRARYLGDAQDVEVAFQQFPAGTELMHSVRYLGVDADGRVVSGTRMKELRYMRKVNVLARAVLEGRYANERKEKLLGELPSFVHRGDAGFDNGLGWYIQGFIEDYEGELRPQSYEEGLFCMGCHSALGTTIDSTFSFARKLPSNEGWGYIDLAGMRDAPNVSEPGGEIANYLARVGGGSEFRENPEVRARFFDAQGRLDRATLDRADLRSLIVPSKRRALDLNKAYVHIVRHQSFVRGRDATVEPARNVYERIDESVVPLLEPYRLYGWDLRLAW